MLKKYLSVIFILGFSLSQGISQEADGHIFGQNDLPLEGVLIFDKEVKSAHITDSEGYFILKDIKSDSSKYYISYFGKLIDSVLIHPGGHFDISIKADLKLQQIEIVGVKENKLLEEGLQKLESIQKTEFRKAACCDLAGCFGTQTSVQSTTTNVLTSAKELRLSGVTGLYTQLLIDGFHSMVGANATYGLSAISAALINTIYISKGACSVIQGHEGMIGQINVITKDDTDPNRWYFTGYINNFGETQWNIISQQNINRVNSTSGLHIVMPAANRDQNNDQFRDNVGRNFINAFQRLAWNSKSENTKSKLTLRYVQQKIRNGQTSFNFGLDPNSQQAYGVQIKIIQPEIYYDLVRTFTDGEFSIKSTSSLHNQNSFFGMRNLHLQQKYHSTVFQYTNSIHLDHKWIIGANYKWTNAVADLTISNAEKYTYNFHVPGLFSEFSGLISEKIEYIAGLRLDYNSALMVTPRALLKFDLDDQNQVRVWMGKGFRNSLPFGDFANLLINGKELTIEKHLRQEKSTNIGFNYSLQINSRKYSNGFSADIEYLSVKDPVFVWYDQKQKVQVLNSSYQSKAISFQMDYKLSGNDYYSVKFGVAYQINNNKLFYNELVPFFSKTRGTAALTLHTPNRNWQLDIQAKYFGKQSAPKFANEEGIFPKAYTQLDLILNKKLKNLEVYLGCENLTGYQQNNIFVTSNQPYSNDFEAGYIWGPTFGQEFFIGVRLSIPKK